MDTSLCAKCGACSTVCPVYRVTGRESDCARGKLHLLGKLADAPHSAAYREIFSRCLLCGACSRTCPRGLDLPGLVAAARGDFPRLTGSGSFTKLLATSCLAHPALLAGVADFLKLSGPLLRKLPADSGLRLKLGLFLESPPQCSDTGTEPPATASPPPPPNTTTIFSGCLARQLRPGIAKATTTLLTSGTTKPPHTPAGQTCCGLAHYSAGDPETARRLARRNLEAFADGDAPIITPCASCYSHLLTYPMLLADDPAYLPRARAFVARLREMSSYLAAAPSTPAAPPPPAPAGTIRVFYHDPCHLRTKPDLCAAPRRLLQAQPGVELVELPDGPRCCGLGGTFNLAHPNLSHQIGATLAEEITALVPDLVVTSCSGCLLQIHRELVQAGSTIRVSHLGEFLARR